MIEFEEALPDSVMDTLLGFARLSDIYGIGTAQPLTVRSRLGTTRQAVPADGHVLLTWPTSYEPEASFRGHFEFGLKYERIPLEFMSRLFSTIDSAEIVNWVLAEPTSKYARRSGFLYEWITGRRLPLPDTTRGGYVDAIPRDLYLVATKPTRNRRWRVNDNLPGTPAFCPMVYLGPPDQRDWVYDVEAGVKSLDEDFGSELLSRRAAWLALKESRASFQIEREADQVDRIAWRQLS